MILTNQTYYHDWRNKLNYLSELFEKNELEHLEIDYELLPDSEELLAKMFRESLKKLFINNLMGSQKLNKVNYRYNYNF